jgi:hypothetical protein
VDKKITWFNDTGNGITVSYFVTTAGAKCVPTSSTNKPIEPGGSFTTERFEDGEQVCWVWEYGSPKSQGWCTERNARAIHIGPTSPCKSS